MTEWKKVYTTIEDRPAEIDTTSSPTTIYERKDFEEETKQDEEGKEVTTVSYMERQYTREEWNMKEAIAEAVSLNHDADVIDAYTMALIEEGAL